MRLLYLKFILVQPRGNSLNQKQVHYQRITVVLYALQTPLSPFVM